MVILLSEIENNGIFPYLSQEVFARLVHARFSGKTLIDITEEEWNSALLNKQKNDEINFLIIETARLNNLGIQLEKDGEIDTAVSVYEENITLGRTATHAYDRLIIIYRKKKDIINEKRILSLALEVFDKENYRRSIIAKENHKDDKHNIEKSYLSNTKCFDISGKIIYNPYNLMKWQQRLTKLLLKN